MVGSSKRAYVRGPVMLQASWTPAHGGDGGHGTITINTEPRRYTETRSGVGAGLRPAGGVGETGTHKQHEIETCLCVPGFTHPLARVARPTPARTLLCSFVLRVPPYLRAS